MSAGQSPAGTDFAARNADVQFVFLPDVSKTAKIVAGLKANALEKYGRRIKIMSAASIVCRPTEKEALDYLHYYVREKGDLEGAGNLIRNIAPNSQSADFADKAFQEAIIAGYGAVPLVGTADQIVEKIALLADAGLDGLTISWVNYESGIEQYEAELLPRLRRKGLRE